MSLLDKHVDHNVAHTGQNYDYELNEIFFRDLELRKPDHFLNVDVSSLEASVGDIIRKSGELLRNEKPTPSWFSATQTPAWLHIWRKDCTYLFSIWKPATDASTSTCRKK